MVIEKWLCISMYFKHVSKDCPERSLPDPEGPLSSNVPSSCTNLEVFNG